MLNSYNVSDDLSQLPAWLSPLEMKLRHRGVQERRDDKVGEWLVRARNFEDGADWVWKMRTITLFYFAMEIRGSV